MSSVHKLNLHSGLPFWLVSNGLLGDFPCLPHNLPDEDIVIIGAGISGALAADALCKAGSRCTMIDRRLLSSGSTWASTAQLNYEIDESLVKLAGRYGEEAAVAIYRSALEAVQRVGEVLEEAGVDAHYEKRKSLYLASDKKGAKENEAEFVLRSKHGLPVALLDGQALMDDYNIRRGNALEHPAAAQLDAYRAAAGLIKAHVRTGALQVFTRTAIAAIQNEKEAVVLQTDTGLTIRAKYVVCAPGYESETFLKKKVSDINSTYALVTQPLPDSMHWRDKALIWESARPYFYLRTTADGRIMLGGGDEPFRNELKRDLLLMKKEDLLLKKCAALSPHLNGVIADFSWCGSFGETADGLPYIGEHPGLPRVSFALGYGGNGTVFSMIAAELIAKRLRGEPDEREALFRFDR